MLALCSVFRNEAHCAAARPSRSPSFIRPARTYTVKVGGELKRPNNVVDRSTTKNVTTAAQPVDLGVGRHLTAPAVSTELPCRSILTDLSAPRPDLHPSSMGVVEIAQGPYRELYHRHPFRSSSIINIDMMYAGHLKVSPEDYPVGWEEKGQHPDDYQILSAPLTQEFFVSPHRRRDDLFWFRTSFRVGKEKFLPMSFLIWDRYPYSWASSYLYFNSRAYELLESYHRIDSSYHIRLVNGLRFPPNMFSPDSIHSWKPHNLPSPNIVGHEIFRKFELKREPHWGWKQGLEYW